MVGMPKGFWAGAGPSEALERPFGITRQGVEETEQADDERFFGQELDCFIEQSFASFQSPAIMGGRGAK
jgi:hypothetical protein